MKKVRGGKKTAPQANPKNAPNEDLGFAEVQKRFSRAPSVTQGVMFGSTGLKVKGKVFAMLVKGALVVKLPKARVW
jgi:hypothetical protein